MKTARFNSRWLAACLLYLSGVLGTVVPAFAASEEIKLEGFDKAVRYADIDLAQYDHFRVEPITLKFDQHWHRDYRFKLSGRDEERIKEAYTRILREELIKTLAEETGLTHSTAGTGQILTVAPQLTKFKLYAPDTAHAARTKHYVDRVGAAELHLEVRASDGQVLISITDYRHTRSFAGLGDLKETNRAINRRDFQMLYRLWAGRLADALR